MLSTMFFRRAHGIMVVYDITDRASFIKAQEHAANAVQAREVKTASEVPFVVVANKCDLSASDREVTLVDGHDFALSIGAELFEVSARTGQNVEPAFLALVNSVIAHSGKGKDKCLVM